MLQTPRQASILRTQTPKILLLSAWMLLVISGCGSESTSNNLSQDTNTDTITDARTDGDSAPDTNLISEDTSEEQDSTTSDTNTPDTVGDTDTLEIPDTAVADTNTGDTGGPPPTPLLEKYIFDGDTAYPESVTYDPVDRAFYAGSLFDGNVLRIEADGTESEYFSGNTEGDWLVLGLEVDAQRRLLWVCAGLSREMTESEVWLFDLETGERIWNPSLESISPGAICIDMIVAEDGSVFIADRSAGKIYRTDAESREITLFASDPLLEPEIIGQNGIALTPDEQYLLTVKLLPVRMMRISMQNPTEVVEVELIKGDSESFSGGADAIVVLDGIIYTTHDKELVRAVPSADWSSANLTFEPFRESNGNPYGGFSGLTVAEGALYASRSNVILFALSLPAKLPFLLHRVETTAFGE